MSDFIKNLLNPPLEIKPGQIWRCSEIQKDVIITNNDFENTGVLRGIFLSGVQNLGDEDDIILDSAEQLNLIAKPKVALRVTEGPISQKALDYFVGELDENTFTAILQSLSKPLSYDEFQEELIAEILEEIEPLRIKAMEEYERWMMKYKSFLELILINKLNYEYRRYTNKYAAADYSVISNEDEFWEKEKSGQEDRLTIISNDDLIIRLSIVEGHLYFIALSESKNEVKNIYLTNGKLIIKALDEKLNIKEKLRVFTSFEESKLFSDSWKLSFNIDGENFTYDIEIKI